MGRPSKLKPELRDKIVELIAAGNFAAQAAAASGIAESSFYNYMRDGKLAHEAQEKGNKLESGAKAKADFYLAVKQAEAQAEQRAIAIILASAQGTPTKIIPSDDGKPTVIEGVKPQWQAAAWYLERKHYDRWGRRSIVDANVKAEHRNVDEAALIPDDQLDAELAALLGEEDE